MSAQKPLPKNLTVGQVAKRSGVAVSTLHYYESVGLIKSWRTSGNQRRYSRDVLRLIAIIKVAQRTGIALEDIKEALQSLPNLEHITAEDWRALSARWKQALNNRIHDLVILRDELDQCIGCGCLSLDSCPLRNPNDEYGSKHSGSYKFILD